MLGVIFMEKQKLPISPRELEVCLMLRDGLCAKEIAAKLNLAYKTVDNLRTSAYNRIGVKKLALMIKWLYEQKL